MKDPWLRMKHSPIWGPTRWPADYAERLEAAIRAIDFAELMTVGHYGGPVALPGGGNFIHPKLVPLVDSAEDILARCEQGMDE